MQNAIDKVELAGDAFAVITEFGEGCAAGSARRIRSADQIFVEIVLLVVGEGERNLALHEHGRKSVIRTLHKFFNNDVILPRAGASVLVSFAGFFGRCRAVDTFAARQIDRLHDNRESKLRNGRFKFVGIVRVDCNGFRRRDAEPCGKCAVFVLMVNFKGSHIGIMPRQSQLFADVHRRKQREIVAAGTNRLHPLGPRQFEHRFFVAKIRKHRLVGMRVAEAIAIVARGNHVPAQRLCGLNQRDFGMATAEKEKFFGRIKKEFKVFCFLVFYGVRTVLTWRLQNGHF